jgi:hypothetical protein
MHYLSDACRGVVITTVRLDLEFTPSTFIGGRTARRWSNSQPPYCFFKRSDTSHNNDLAIFATYSGARHNGRPRISRLRDRAD